MARNKATSYYDRFVRNSGTNMRPGRLSKDQFRDMMEDIAFRESLGINKPCAEVPGQTVGHTSDYGVETANQSSNLKTLPQSHPFFISLDGKRMITPPGSKSAAPDISNERGFHTNLINGSYAIMAMPSPFEYQIPRPTRITTPAMLEMVDGLKDPQVRLTGAMMHLVYAYKMLEDLGDYEGSDEVKRSGAAIFGTKVFADMLDWIAGKRLVSDFVWT